MLDYRVGSLVCGILADLFLFGFGNEFLRRVVGFYSNLFIVLSFLLNNITIFYIIQFLSC